MFYVGKFCVLFLIKGEVFNSVEWVIFLFLEVLEEFRDLRFRGVLILMFSFYVVRFFFNFGLVNLYWLVIKFFLEYSYFYSEVLGLVFGFLCYLR